jgi:hypothetical protein
MKIFISTPLRWSFVTLIVLTLTWVAFILNNDGKFADNKIEAETSKNHISDKIFLPEFRDQMSKVPYSVPIVIESATYKKGTLMGVSYNIPNELLKFKNENPTCLDPLGKDKILYEFLVYNLDKERFNGGVFYGNGYRPLSSFSIWNTKDIYVGAGISDDIAEIDPGRFRIVLLAYHPFDKKCNGKDTGFVTYENDIMSDQILDNLVGFGYSDEFVITE